MNTTQSVQIIDTTGNMHTIEITADGIMLDGRPCQLKVKGNQIALLSVDPTLGIITIDPAAFWHAFAGGDPTPDSAGVIQAQALAHWGAMQELSQVMVRLQSLLHDLERHLQPFGEAPLPAYRFDPFTLQLLHTYDGTEEHVAALARLLKQLPETIYAWLASIGLVPDREQPSPVLEGEAAPVPGPDGTAAPAREQLRAFRWTPVTIQQLTDAFFASDEPSISAVSRAIAGKYGWPVESVEYKIYHLGLPRQREQQHHQQDSETSVEQEEEGQPVIAVGTDLSRPIEISAEQKEVGQTEAAAGVSANAPDLEDGSYPLPASLSSGNFLWDVKIDGKLQRWPLDVAYGMFPFSRPGTPLVYREQQYVLQQVGTSVIAVTQERRTVMQVATV